MTLPTQQQVAALDAHNRNIAWLRADPIDAGTVEVDGTAQLDLAPYAFPVTGASVTAGDGTEVTTTESGLVVTIDATGAAEGPDSFMVTLTAASGTSDQATVDVETVAATTESMEFWHYWMGSRGINIWNLEAPQLMTMTDSRFSSGNIAAAQAAGILVMRNVYRGGELDPLIDGGATAQEIADYLEARLTDFGENFDGISLDEISPAPQNETRSQVTLDAGALFKAANPGKLWCPYHTGGPPQSWFWPYFSSIDFCLYEAYQCCGTPCDPDLSIITNRANAFVAQGDSVVEKTIFLINLAFGGQPSCETRPTTTYFDAQIEKLWELVPNAAGIGTASGTSGSMDGIAYNDYDPVVRASSWAARF